MSMSDDRQMFLCEDELAPLNITKEIAPTNLPKITTDFEKASDNPANNVLYREIVKNILLKILPVNFFSFDQSDDKARINQYEYLNMLLPFTTNTPFVKAPSNTSFYILSKYRANSFKFYFEMISRWLVPGKRLNVLMIYAVDFRFPELSNDTYTVCEVMLHIESKAEMEEIMRNLPIIETEVRLGIESSFYARRILEVKGLASDEKTAMIQEHIANLVRRMPKIFDLNIFSEMQHVLVLCRDEFKACRDSIHLSRVISAKYLFRKALRKAVKEFPEKRHLKIKLFRVSIHTGIRTKKMVLGIAVGVNFLRDKEIFEEAHVLKAVQNYIPDTQIVENSGVMNKRGNENICTLYVEIEKSTGENFTNEDIRILRSELPADLEGRIEHLMHPIFMPRNEEEIMRNILSLSNQIRYLRDIPQVFISFDEQSPHDLFFTVILVRVIKSPYLPIAELFNRSETFLEYIHDRCKAVGYIRKKYKKEATVFRVKVLKDEFLRRDHSIDLYKARQTVVRELTRIVGEFRDFNGGMISKQNELLSAVRVLLAGEVRYNELLLENFFYSLTPVIMRTLLEPEVLKKLFVMLIESISEGFFKDESYSLKIRSEPDAVYVLIAAENQRLEEEICRMINELYSNSASIASASVSVYDIPYLGYIYRTDNPAKQRQFCEVIQALFKAAAEKKTTTKP